MDKRKGEGGREGERRQATGMSHYQLSVISCQLSVNSKLKTQNSKLYFFVVIALTISCCLFVSFTGCRQKPERDFTAEAERFYAEGKYEDAVNSAKSAISKNAKDQKAYYVLGKAYMETGKTKEAEVALKKVRELNPNTPEGKLAKDLLKTLTAQKGPEKEPTELEVFVKEKTIRTQILPTFKTHRKSDAYLFYVRGVQNSIKGKWDMAIASLEKAIDIDPDYTPTYSHLGVAYAKKGLFNKAITVLQQATVREPRNLLAHYNLGAIYEGQGQWMSCVSSYRQVLEIDPNNVEVMVRLGVCFVETGQRETARDMWNMAVTLDPNHKVAHVLLGKVYLEYGLDKFRPVGFGMTVEEDTGFVKVDRGTAETAGSKYYDVAIDQFRQALHIDSRYAEAYYGLGVTLAKAALTETRVVYFDEKQHRDSYDGRVRRLMTIDEMLKASIYYLKRAVAYDPRNAIYHTNLGVVYGESGYYELAKYHLQIARRLDPTLYAASTNLAVVLSHQGAVSSAIAGYKKNLKVEPSKVRGQETLSLIQPTVSQLAGTPTLQQPAGVVSPSASGTTGTGG